VNQDYLFNSYKQQDFVEDLVEMVENLARIIASMEKERREAGERIREKEGLILKAEQESLDGCVVGIDGGMVKKSFHGVDLLLLRSVAVVFYYKDNKLSHVAYYPDSLPKAELKVVVDPFSDLEFEVNSNIERQIKEVENAREALEKFEPDILFLHGSIIPHYTFVPDKSTLLYISYKRMIEAYQKLFDSVKKAKTVLAGVIEDSRGARFCELVSQILPEYKLILSRSKDSNILSYSLKVGERTVSFPYSSDVKTHPILKEFKDAEKVQTFYIRLGEFDQPVRIDFLADKEDADKKISSVLLACAGNASYSIPPVLVEADQRARLSENDLEAFYYDILTKTGSLPSMLELRRERRPF
jgi:hypothetical protein